MTGPYEHEVTSLEIFVGGEWVDLTPYMSDKPLEPQCIECVAPDEDPAPWCDCQMGETCAQGPCRRRAHEPRHCPTPGRW